MGSRRTSLIFRNLSLPSYTLNNPNIDLQKSMVEELQLDYCASSLATLPRPLLPPLSLTYTIQSFPSLPPRLNLLLLGRHFQSSESYLEKLKVGQMTNLRRRLLLRTILAWTMPVLD
ncbi:hypothetical protein ACE6H2_022691 [Prunus campanulata]